jgi:hypothetical protein
MDDVIERNRMLLERPDFTRPPSWSDSHQILVPLTPLDDAYWDVTCALQESMPDAHIALVWRVQNAALWSYYSFQQQRLAWNGINVNETWVWHGTSKRNPSVIYNDTQDGFMMQYANFGLWGYVFLGLEGSPNGKPFVCALKNPRLICFPVCLQPWFVFCPAEFVLAQLCLLSIRINAVLKLDRWTAKSQQRRARIVFVQTVGRKCY